MSNPALRNWVTWIDVLATPCADPESPEANRLRAFGFWLLALRHPSDEVFALGERVRMRVKAGEVFWQVLGDEAARLPPHEG